MFVFADTPHPEPMPQAQPGPCRPGAGWAARGWPLASLCSSSCEDEIAGVDGVHVAHIGEQHRAGAVVDVHAGAGVGQIQIAEIIDPGHPGEFDLVGAILEIGDLVGAVAVVEDERVGAAGARQRVVVVESLDAVS
jgi:hypothetical protein